VGALLGKTILLTGASSGIGRALALELAAQRPRLVLASRDTERLEQVARACRDQGADTLVVKTDVGVESDCRALVARTLERFAGIDVLINNAGIGMIARFDELKELSGYERVMRVNYLGCVYLTHAALPQLRASRGRIAVVASLAGLNGVPTRTAYAASKHAVIGFFDSLRIELQGSGVSVTIACPDFVVSEIQRRSIGADGKPLGTTPLQEDRIMSAEACARQIVSGLVARERMLVMSLRGRLGRFAKLLAPGLIDRIAARAVREGK
jgi:short-subunit dehydrogenase